MVSFRLRESPVEPPMQLIGSKKPGISEYAQNFANDIDFSILNYATDQGLTPGVASLGHRCRILPAIAELDRPESNGRAPNRRVGCRAAIDKTVIWIQSGHLNCRATSAPEAASMDEEAHA